MARFSSSAVAAENLKSWLVFYLRRIDKDRFIDVMLHGIALNGSFFNTHRMVQQYVLNAYF